MFQNLCLLVVGEPFELLNMRNDVVESQPRLGIDGRADSRTLGSVEHPVHAYRPDQQLQGFRRVQDRVVVKLADPVAKAFTRAARRGRVETAELIRHGAAAVRDEDLQAGKVNEHGRIDETVDGDRLLVDEVQRVRLAFRVARAGRMDMTDDVELAQLLVQRIPVAVAERRSLRCAVLVRIRIDQTTLESELADAALELGERLFDRRAGGLGQAGDAEELVRHELAASVDDVVRFLGPVVDDLRRLLGVHHLERPRRNALHVYAAGLHVLEMAGRRHLFRVPRRQNVVVAEVGAGASMSAAVGD